ncbi:MAG: HDOD domain-containing protein [Pseudomonadota bacterium]
MNTPHTEVRDAISRKVQSLPTLPQVVTNIIAIVRDERSTTGQLAGYIRKDQVICATVLRVANSAYYGSYRKVDSIDRAIVVLGFEQVRSIALSIGVFAKLPKSSQSFDKKHFWFHCIGVATAARLIAERRGERDEFFFVSGLMHDIGKLVLDHYAEINYGRVIEEAQETSRPVIELELQNYGVDHAEVGQQMLERWKLPEHIVDGVRLHHASNGGEARRVAPVVALADNLTHEAQIGLNGHLPGLDTALGRQLGFTPAQLLAMTEELSASRERIEGFFKALQ